MTPMDRDALDAIVANALAEDLGDGDVTVAATIPAGARARAVITQKQAGVVSGLDAAQRTFERCDPDVRVTRLAEEGAWHEPPHRVLEIEGTAAGILAAERTALNFLQRLSGVATLTAAYVAAIEGTGARIIDTRKTTPGLRLLEKEAVVHGGGTNHRIGLWDMVLIKENHIAAAGGVGAAVRAAQAHAPGLPLEVEVETMAELDEALEAQAPRILLDNMDAAQLREAVERVAGRAETEASGGISLQTVRDAAATGVTYVSVGALTHSAPALDLSLILEPLP
jgi:nicotinate-nucleotide pyrophosphorylase (carboxylating)